MSGISLKAIDAENCKIVEIFKEPNAFYAADKFYEFFLN